MAVTGKTFAYFIVWKLKEEYWKNVESNLLMFLKVTFGYQRNLVPLLVTQSTSFLML